MSSGDLEQAGSARASIGELVLAGAPHVPAAYLRLATIAQTAESRGEPMAALFRMASDAFGCTIESMDRCGS